MHMLRGLNMRVDASKQELLAVLRANRAEHGKLYQEALKGFADTARAKLTWAIKRIESGKTTGVSINLEVPKDHTAEYDTVIKTLELHQGDTVQMAANEVRMLVEDEWEWSAHWLTANALYSDTIAEVAHAKGVVT